MWLSRICIPKAAAYFVYFWEATIGQTLFFFKHSRKPSLELTKIQELIFAHFNEPYASDFVKKAISSKSMIAKLQ
jgi:hypothetical protein